jgi:hypothetical protein
MNTREQSASRVGHYFDNVIVVEAAAHGGGLSWVVASDWFLGRGTRRWMDGQRDEGKRAKTNETTLTKGQAQPRGRVFPLLQEARHLRVSGGPISKSFEMTRTRYY